MKSTVMAKIIAAICFSALSTGVFAANPVCPATEQSFVLGASAGGAHYVINIKLTGSKVIKGKKGKKDKAECSYKGEKWAHYSQSSPSTVFLGYHTYKKSYVH